MRWGDERYVRFYTRDTVAWLLLSFEAQGLFGLLLRKVDRAGLLPLQGHGARAVAVALGHAARWETIGPALDELLQDGCVEIHGDVLVVRNFLDAQEAVASGAQRQREYRARARDKAAEYAPDGPNVTPRNGPVTPRSPDVTSRYETVTPSLAVPSRAAALEQRRGGESDPFPLAADFQRRLEDRLARTAPFPRGGGREVLEQIEAALRLLPVDAAVEAVRQRDADGARTGSRPKTLKLVAAILADEVSRRATGPPPSRRVVGADENGQPIFAENSQ